MKSDLTHKSLRFVGKMIRSAGMCVCALLLDFSGAGVLNAQTRPGVGNTIEGVVTDGESDLPLVGVVVSDEGNTVHTLTADDGSYVLQMGDGIRSLTYSILGYKTATVELGQDSRINVKMYPDVEVLDEIVVVGYGSQKKSDITGAVGSVSRDRIESSTVTDAAQMLQGSVPGLTVMTTSAGANPEGQSGLMLIRGRNSISASNDPLIILDGVPYNGSISDIPTTDIASIEVLKDASSAAIYGSRGSNGVILISTRTGEEGKMQIRYNGYFSVQTVANFPHIMDGQEYYDFKKYWSDDEDDPEGFLSDTELGVYADGSWKNWTWKDLITQTGWSTQHSVSASGGTKALKYNTSLSFLDTKGIVRNDQYKKLTFRLNLSANLTKWLTYTTSTQLSWADNSGATPKFVDVFNKSPLLRPFNDDGSINIVPDAGNEKRYNPIECDLYDDMNMSYKLSTNNSLKATFFKGFTYTLNTGVQYFSSTHNEYQGLNTGAMKSYNGWASMYDRVRQYYSIENILNFDREFGKHHLFVTLLYSFENARNNEKTVEGQGFPNDLLSWNGLPQAEKTTISLVDEKTVLLSQMARVNYSYDERYLFTATVRRDGYSGFGANNKWGVFPSVALGWNISNEGFFRQYNDIMNVFKLRLSYGMNGNQAISAFQTISRMTSSDYVSGSSLAVGYIPGTLGTPSLSWETTRAANVGIDFGFLDSRISGEINAYYNRTNDLLLERSISSVNGIESIYQNIGKTDNRGIELSIVSTNIQTRKFSWKTAFNIAYYKTRILDLYGNKESDIDNKWFIGEPVKANYDYYIIGVWQEDEAALAAKYGAQPGYAKYDDRNGNGVYDADDRQVIGSPEPDMTWSLNNTFSYGPFELSVYMYGATGMVKANPFYAKNMYISREYWSPDNPINTYWSTAKDANQYISAKSVTPDYFQNANYWRIKDVMLSYSLPKKAIGKIGLSNAKVYVTGKNLFTFTKYTGMDPELDEQRAKPLQREFIIGVNLTF